MVQRFTTVRVRTTVGATIVVAVALALSGMALSVMLRTTMITDIDAALELRAADLGSIIAAGALPQSATIDGEGDGFVQIIGSDGQVIASSTNIEGEPALGNTQPATATDAWTSVIDGDHFRVVAHPTDDAGSMTVIVGRSLDEVHQTTSNLNTWMLLGGPALTLLVATITWTVVGRALRPVEAMRAEVADIGGSDLHRRVSAPTANDEIGRLAATMNAMLDRLEAASERQQHFVSDASHELRTPIATVRHEIEVARRVPLEQLPATLDDISDENQRMQHLVDDLLLLAQQDQVHDVAAHAVARLTIVDLDDLALVEAHRRRATDVAIDASGLDDAPVYGDERQLGRVVRNLVDNAVRHAHHRVALTTHVGAEATHLTVDDDGPGIDVKDRERVFERFTRTDSARARDGGGSGLGLAIASELVQNHGGKIEIGDSKALGGARVTVTLPNPNPNLTTAPH